MLLAMDCVLSRASTSKEGLSNTVLVLDGMFVGTENSWSRYRCRLGRPGLGQCHGAVPHQNRSLESTQRLNDAVILISTPWYKP